jgi:hypothetical protein
VILVLLGLAVAAIVFIVTGGHVLFLPLFFILPLAPLWLRGRRRGGGWRRS